ncbi:glutamate methylesterase [Leptospira tipperaryensis]|uniref:protein-glutamate methylesterase n=1 Tax=Leptospira tipperaryensis TaxID=2564040 RepID=A0A1D7UWV7_9LEPT|nr:chemotaxis protein CheB [Leptospira tipperaryensis]AOP34067.1 glutamate methylesterase [Leptospira tipperaryensis]
MKYEVIVMGASSGGLNAIKTVLTLLSADFAIPIILVQHVSPRSDGQWIRSLHVTGLNIKEADEKETIQKGNVYVAPPNYHLLIETDKTFSLTIDTRVNFARPSIDVLFESAADAYREKIVGIIFTGANSDGAIGLKRIKELGGTTIVQDPNFSESRYMPEAAISLMPVDYVLPLEKIAELLNTFDKDN